jgi:hypothetical protein
VPDWFEDLARKMANQFGEQISLPELTLVTAIASAPEKRVAAAERRISSAPAESSAKGGVTPKDAYKDEDIDQLARDIYDEVRRMFQVERERNGDLWRS